MNLDNEILTNIKTDQALNSILEKFDTNYIIHIVEDSINMRFRPYNTAMPGLNAMEEYFQRNINAFPPTDVEQIIAVRYETYRKIIDIVCNFYNLTYIENPQVDIYSVIQNLFILETIKDTDSGTKYYERIIFKATEQFKKLYKDYIGIDRY